MIFADFVNTLKKHFKRAISNEELCGILFDAIIEPTDLKNRKGELMTIEKGEISRIMNQKKSMPSALRDHVYDNAVLDGIGEYFQTQIVEELVPDRSDLCHQLMRLIDEDNDISRDHKATLRVLANPNTVAVFLAEAFIYVIRQDNKLTVNRDEPVPEGYVFPPNYTHRLSEYTLHIEQLDKDNITIDISRD